MRPEDVRTRYFDPRGILYDGGPEGTALAWGRWMPGTPDETFCLATRWNGADDANGYPASRGYPQWFAVDEPMAPALLKHVAFGSFGPPAPRRLNRPLAMRLLRERYLPADGTGHEARADGGEDDTQAVAS